VYIKIAIIAENRKLKIFHFPFSIFNFQFLQDLPLDNTINISKSQV